MLTNAAIKAAEPRPRAYKVFDTGGLYLFVAPTGSKCWRFKYRFGGKEQLLTIGRFPAVTLPEARLAREAAKAQLRAGTNPARSSLISGRTFEEIARLWCDHKNASWAPRHGVEVLDSLVRDVFPQIGKCDITAITPARLLELLRGVEARGAIETARRLRYRLSGVFQFGIAQSIVTSDPARHLLAAMRIKPLSQPMRALTTAEDCRALLAACERAKGPIGARLASEFLALTAVRSGALRGMRWGEVEGIGGPNPLWVVPAERMKMGVLKKTSERFAHHVPLSSRAIDVLARAAKARGHCLGEAPATALVFTGRNRAAPLGENALRSLYSESGFAERHVPHGWRASFSTILNETLGPEWRIDIDRTLGHGSMGKVEAAYNRSQQMDRRRALMERWAEILTG